MQWCVYRIQQVKGVFGFEQGDKVSCDALMFVIIGRLLECVGYTIICDMTVLLLLLYCVDKLNTDSCRGNGIPGGFAHG